MQYEPRRNYVSVENPIKRRARLSADAFDIVGSEPNTQTQKSTVCFCVALRDKNKYVKNFAFHNGASVMSPDMRSKAHELGYDVIQAEQAHAEGQMVQFLLYRNKVRPGEYTHIMGMGCSKCHCAECDHILKRVLGSNYHEITASVMQKKDSKDLKIGPISATSKTSSSDEAENSDADVSFTQNIGQTIAYTVIKGEKTVDTAFYSNCYLPESLKRVFGEDHNFSAERFTKRPRKKLNSST